MMEWTDLDRLDSLILKMQALGAQVEEIGVSGEGRSLYGITIGDNTATRTVVIIAGCHANEIIGPLAAVSLLNNLLHHPIPTVKFRIVPVADPDFLHRNSVDFPENPTLRDLLNIKHSRDLEGCFTADAYPECMAIRQWIQQSERVDAYFSLHSAGLISPGVFFYIGSDADPRCVDHIIPALTTVLPDYISLLSYDPTGNSQTLIAWPL